MNKLYYLSKNGIQTGPFEHGQILELIKTENISWSDYICPNCQSEWSLLLVHSDFASEFLPKPTLHHSTEPITLTDKAWFILRYGNNFGPFSQLDMIQMLQNKSLYEFDYVWKFGFNTWLQISQINEFSNENIRNLHERKDLDISEIFFRRRHARAKIGTSLLVHNSKSVFKGVSLEISAGGAGIVLENSSIQPGQSLFLHFKPGEGVPPFNAICQVVSKQNLSTPRNSQNPQVKYGVRFTNISHQVRESIETYIKNNQAAS